MSPMPAWRSYRRQTFALQPPNKGFWGSCLSAGFDIGDRGASGLDSWYLCGVKLKLCSHSHTPRANLVAEAEVCGSKEIRGPLLRLKKTSLYKGRKPPWWPKREGAPSHNKCGHAPIGLCGGIHLSKKAHTSLGGSKDQSGVKKVTKLLAKWKQRLEVLSYINNLNHHFYCAPHSGCLHSSRGCVSCFWQK